LKGSGILKKLLVAASLAGAGFYGYVRLVKKRSLSSYLFEQLIVRSEIKDQFAERTEEDFKEFLEEQVDIQSNPVKTPNLYISSTVKNEHKYGMQVFTWNDKEDPNQKVIYYFHGGAYVFQPTLFHYLSVDSIAKALDAKVVFPIYPRAPLQTYKDAYPKLLNLYEEIMDSVESPEQITIMGDSAGGGLALGMGVYIRENNLSQPKDIILLSPWIDIFTQHPDMSKIYDNDPMLDAWLPARIGIMWADGTENLRNPLVSPTFADVSHLAPISISIGTRDILFPSVRLFHEKLKDLGIPHNMTIAENQNHVYQLFPTLEGLRARNNIKDIINSKEKPTSNNWIDSFMEKELGISNTREKMNYSGCIQSYFE